MGEKKDKEYDAPHATCMAVEAGILPGGGVVLLNAPHHALLTAPIPTSNFDQHLSVSIILRTSSALLVRSSITRARSPLAHDLVWDGKEPKDKLLTVDVEVAMGC